MIILDTTQCNNRDFATVAPPPPPTVPVPPSPTASETCKTFYDLVTSHFTEPLICTIQESCDDGVRCRLDILNTNYFITISVSEPRTGLSMVVTDFRGQVVGGGSSDVVNVSLPVPEGSNLTLNQKYDPGAETVGMQVSSYT